MDLKSLQEAAARLIPKSRWKIENLKNNYDTNDIINLVIEKDGYDFEKMKEFSKCFPDDANGLKMLWNFVRRSFRFKLDKKGSETVKTPMQLWAEKEGNCKGYSNFIASVLTCKGIPYKYRFPVFKGEDETRHVYIICWLHEKQYVLDSTVNKFNYAEPRIRQIEIDPKKKSMPLRFISSPKMSAPNFADIVKDAPQGVAAKPYHDYTDSTEGGLTIMLMKDQLNILDDYYGDYNGTLKAKKDILNDYENKLHTPRPASISAKVQQEFANFFTWLNYANSNRKAAGSNFTVPGSSGISGPTNFTADEIISQCNYITEQYKKRFTQVICTVPPTADCIKRRNEQLAFVPKKSDGSIYPDAALVKDYNACIDKKFFVELFNKHLEVSSPHLCYEFLDPQKYAFGSNVISNKISNQKLCNSNFALFGNIDRPNVVLWQNNGMQRIGATIKLDDISPLGFIDNLARIDGKGINNPIVVPAIVGAIAAALGAISEFLRAVLAKRASLVDNFKGVGTEGFGPEPADWSDAASSAFDSGDLTLPLAGTAAGIAALIYFGGKK